MRTITINGQDFQVPLTVTSFTAGLEAVEASAKALPADPTPEQAAESKRALDAIKAHRAAEAKTKAEASKPTTEGAK